MPMEKVERIVVMFRRKFGSRKPVFGEFLFAIGHVLAAEDAEREHLFWCELRLEVRIKIASHWFGKLVFVILLEFIIYFDSLFSHKYLLSAYKIHHQEK